MQPFEIIHFSIGGLKLQEPGALITNWLISIFCIVVFFKTNWSDSYSSKSFKNFYLLLGISTFFGGLGHLFYQYFGIYGKFPCWITGIIAGLFIGEGVLFYWKEKQLYQFWRYFLFIKAFLLLFLSIGTGKFIFVAVDAVLTYVLYTGFLSWKLWKTEKKEMRYFVYGMGVLFPSIFIFLLNFNIHRNFNRDDFSHLLMLACVVLFYLGIRKINKKYLPKTI
jgi:hypothetical protein